MSVRVRESERDSQSCHRFMNSPSSSVAPHPEIQHMLPASKSSPWFGRQMGSINPAEDNGRQLQLPECSTGTRRQVWLYLQKDSQDGFRAFKKAQQQMSPESERLQLPPLFTLLW